MIHGSEGIPRGSRGYLTQAGWFTSLGYAVLVWDKRGIGDLNVVVTFAGVTFRPGQYVYADNNGIIVSPEPLSMPE